MNNLSSFWVYADFGVWDVLDVGRWLDFCECWYFYILASIYKSKNPTFIEPPSRRDPTSFLCSHLVNLHWTLWGNTVIARLLQWVDRNVCPAHDWPCCSVNPSHPPLISEKYVESLSSLIQGFMRSSFSFIYRKAFISVECEVRRPGGRGLCSALCPVLHWSKAVISESKIHTDVLPGSRHKQLFTLGFVWLRSGRQEAARDLLLEAENGLGFILPSALTISYC